MGTRGICVAAVRVTFFPAVVLWLLSGCQTANFPTRAAFEEHREQVSATGLAAPMDIDALKVNLAVPEHWRPIPGARSPLYLHQQWRSNTRRTAVGVAYVHLPLPLSTKTLAWLIRSEIGKRTTGQLMRQWTDELGREWFEGENDKYHTIGYVMTRGTDAWVNYCGYRTTEQKEAAEIELATRSLNTIVPTNGLPTQQAAAE